MTPHDIFKLFGRTVVLLKIAPRSKRPIEPGWENKREADMTKEFVASLNGNIGILHGLPSGGLLGIEWDERSVASQFYLANPWAQHCLWSKAKRGPCFWVYIEGNYPPNHDFYDRQGKRVGEWRADGRQTVFTGTHPDGMEYKHSEFPPARIKYSDIVWPDGILKEKPKAPPPDVHTTLVAKCGAPFIINPQTGNMSKFNPNYFAQRFCLETLVLFELEERRFYVYIESDGAWHGVALDLVKTRFKEYYERLCKTTFAANDWQLLPRCTNAFETAITNNIQGICGRTKVFRPLQRLIHCKNGMLRLDANRDCVLLPFSPNYYSRNPIPINWKPEAPAPMFEGILATLPAHDASLFIRYAGNILLTGNAAQSILIMNGEGGTSKSTLCELIELVMGEDNIIELRTQFLNERFEIGRYIGKTLLTGKDVKGDFLSQEGASYLKKLTGHDNQTGEVKGTMEKPLIRGEFAVLITCNERLLVRLEGQKDVSAWKRRLLIITMSAASRHKEVIEEYAKKMFASEGEGVLFRMVQGAIDHLEERATRNVFALHPEQENRVDTLLAESQSIEVFLKAQVFKNPGGDGISTDELCSAYGEYCEERGWTALKIEKVKRDLPNHMFVLFAVHPSNRITRGADKKVRGYPDVSLMGESTSQEGEFDWENPTT